MAQLKAGAAKVKMTPTGDAWPAMGMLPNQEYTKVHDDIYVRVLVLDNGEKKVVFLAMELQRAFFADEIREYLQEKYGIDPGYVFLNGTIRMRGRILPEFRRITAETIRAVSGASAIGCR